MVMWGSSNRWGCREFQPVYCISIPKNLLDSGVSCHRNISVTHIAVPAYLVLLVRSSAPIASPFIAHRTHKEGRSEEHTSELQSRGHLVCRLLLEKKKKKKKKKKNKKKKKKKQQ